MQKLVAEKASIHAIGHKIGSNGIVGKIEMAAPFTAAMAKSMGCEWVIFDKEKLVKGGFKSIELDYEMNGVRANFVPNGNLANLTLDMTSESVTKFKVQVSGDGKKKSKRLMVRFVLSHSGSAVPLIEYLQSVGGAEGKLTLTPVAVQTEMPLDGKSGKEAAAKAIEKSKGKSDVVTMPAKGKEVVQ